MRRLSPGMTALILCRRLVIVAALIFTSQLALAQDKSSGGNIDSLPPKHPPQKDIIDVLTKTFHIKRDSTPDSVKIKPGRLLLAIIPAVGYTPQTGITALLAANVSFYTGHASTTNLSTIVLSQNYSLKHQVIIPMVSNIWTKGNKYNLLGDWRYYKYPTFTYGIGGHTRLANADLIDYSYVKVYQQVLKRITKKFYGGIGYGLDYHFNVHEQGSGSNFNQYNDSATKTTSSGLLFNVIYDSRGNINSPDNGMYASIRYHPCFTSMGSDNNWQSIVGDFRKYIRLTKKGNNVLALWSLNWFTFGGKVPYFDLPSTGWDTYSNSGRGYIQGRLRGANMIYMEAEYRFGLTKNGLFGGVLFTNAHTVSDWPSNKFETILPSVGTGIRIKVNKYSKVNFAIDYAVGIDGSKGLYFNLSELF